jgi:uncharacterized membrane protein SpoIIM required for sporulation
MISTGWLKRRQPHWMRLEELLADVKRLGLKGLGRNQLRELGLLYRQTAADLSAVRADSASSRQARYLNQLLGRVHNIIYSGQKTTAKSVLRFYLHEYPRIFRRLLPYTAVATAIFFAAALIGMAITLSNPEFMRDFLGPGMVATIERHQMWTHSIIGVEPQSSSAIMTNNLSVSFVAFASGIVAGLGTLYMMFFNGLMLGVIGAACWLNNMSDQLWSFVAPHGVLELPAIYISGGAGLRLARALLFPGNLSRRDSLIVGGAEASRLIVGVIPVLILAGIIEGFFSPSSVRISIKFAFAAALFTAFVFYLWGAGRSNSRPHSEDVPSTVR